MLFDELGKRRLPLARRVKILPTMSATAVKYSASNFWFHGDLPRPTLPPVLLGDLQRVFSCRCRYSAWQSQSRRPLNLNSGDSYSVRTAIPFCATSARFSSALSIDIASVCLLLAALNFASPHKLHRLLPLRRKARLILRVI